MTLLAAVDEGRPCTDAARALALATLATEPPGSPRWGAAVAVLEGGALRTRRAVLLAGELLDGEDTHDAASPPYTREGGGSL